MEWPLTPTCHGEPDPVFKYGGAEWSRKNDSEPRHCTYCGSIHPEDMYDLFTGKAVINEPRFDPHEAIEKVGGNPEDYLKALHAHQREVNAMGPRLHGADWKYGWPHKFYIHGASAGYIKWYNQHLDDKGYDDEAWKALVDLLECHGGVKFFRNEKGQLAFKAPYCGFQR